MSSDNEKISMKKKKFGTLSPFSQGAIEGAAGGIVAAILIIGLIFLFKSNLFDRALISFEIGGILGAIIVLLYAIVYGVPVNIIVGLLTGILSVKIFGSKKRAFLIGLTSSFLLEVIAIFIIFNINIY